MNKLMLILAPLLMVAGAAGGYMASTALRGPVELNPTPSLAEGPEISHIEAGRFAFIIPGSVLEKPAVFMVNLNVKTGEAPESLSRMRDTVNEILVATLEMPIVRTDKDVLAKMEWALPHAAQEKHPWIVDAKLTLVN